jgi:hypothetical protein
MRLVDREGLIALGVRLRRQGGANTCQESLARSYGLPRFPAEPGFDIVTAPQVSPCLWTTTAWAQPFLREQRVDRA